MPDLKWEEVRGLMGEVQELFAGREDVCTVEEVGRLQQEIREGLQAKQDQAAALIRALSSEVEETQARVDRLPASKEVSDSRRAEAGRLVAQSQERVGQVAQAMAHTHNNITGLHQQMSEAEEEASGVEKCGNEQGHDRLRHAISLYGNITGVQWKYDDSKHHLLHGYAAIADSAEVVWFELDCTRESKFDMANRLWDLIDPPPTSSSTASS